MLGKLCYTTVQTAANYVGAYEAGVVSANDYYPFGLAMGNRSYNSPNYRYGFNGKEKDDQGEWGSNTNYDYGFRIYNPSIARFLSVDPLAKEFPWFTPYQFAGNTPIRAIDLDGLEFFIPPILGSNPILVSGNAGTISTTSTLGTLGRIGAIGRAIPNQHAPPVIFNPEMANNVPESLPGERAPADPYAEPFEAPYEPMIEIPEPAPRDGGLRDYDIKPIISPDASFGNRKRIHELDIETGEPFPEATGRAKPYHRDGKSKWYVTYQKIRYNADGTTTVYSGRTSYIGKGTISEAEAAIKARDAAHHVTGEFGPGILDVQSKNYAAIRGREQQLIDLNGGAITDYNNYPNGGTSGNVIRQTEYNTPTSLLYHNASSAEFGEIAPYNQNNSNN